jgi:hypothetical protein
LNILSFNAHRHPTGKLTVPEIIEHLWRIADESRPDPTMKRVVEHVLAALNELIALRSLAHEVMLQQHAADTEPKHPAADNLPVTDAPFAPASRALPPTALAPKAPTAHALAAQTASLKMQRVSVSTRSAPPRIVT